MTKTVIAIFVLSVAIANAVVIVVTAKSESPNLRQNAGVGLL